jgi:trimethylamine--corrinoid protein Co-methyltransferase
MGYEKFVMDADQAGMMHTLLAGVDLSENGQALEAIREVGPGKHFLGCAHTLANFETASIVRRSRTTTATSSGRRRAART